MVFIVDAYNVIHAVPSVERELVVPEALLQVPGWMGCSVVE
jgi:hypothetical protein